MSPAIGLLEKAVQQLKEARATWIIVALAAATSVAVGLFSGDAQKAFVAVVVGLGVLIIFHILHPPAGPAPNRLNIFLRAAISLLFVALLFLLLTCAFFEWPTALPNLGKGVAKPANAAPSDGSNNPNTKPDPQVELPPSVSGFTPDETKAIVEALKVRALGKKCSLQIEYRKSTRNVLCQCICLDESHAGFDQRSIMTRNDKESPAELANSLGDVIKNKKCE